MKCLCGCHIIGTSMQSCAYCEKLGHTGGTYLTQQKEKEEKKNIRYLDRCFQVDKPSKTLKIKLRDGFTPEEGVTDAKRYLTGENTEGYTRIEFKHNNLYYVIAKLRE